MMKHLRQSFKQAGFTLIEMLVIAPIVILAIGAFITVIISMTGEVLSSRGSNTLAYNIQDALNRMEQDVKLSTTFLGQNNVTLTAGEAQGYNNDATNFTNVGGASGTSLVLNMLVTNGNPVSTSTGVVFLADSPNNCASPQINENTPMTMNVVYFVKDNTLWRRTIMPSNYANSAIRCSAPWQQPSCAPGYASTFCKTNDIKLVDGVSATGLTLDYFTAINSNIPNAAASDVSAGVADRNTALQSTPTVRASLSASQSVAGRTIERSATLRVSRLDMNASAIGVATAPTTPSAPTINSSTTAPTNVVFSWPAVNGATTYTMRYRVNGGAWTVAFTNQNTRTFTVTSATHTNVVEAEVTASNAAGTSAEATNSITVPLWTPLTMQNNWTMFQSPFASPGYTKTSAGLVVLKGMIRSGTISATIATLPAGYRPGGHLMFENTSNQTGGRLDVYSSGDINQQVGSNAWLSLDGLTFMPAGSGLTNVTAFVNGWSNYSTTSGDPNWAPTAYMLDSLGRVQIQGMVRGGTNPANIFTVPVGTRPSEYLHIVNDQNNALAHYSIDTAGNIIGKGGANGYVSMQAMYYPTGRATGTSCTTEWCNLSLLNGWAYYAAGYASPQYTKSSDNVVMLKGLIKSGSGNIANLPAGFCPKEQLLFTIVANSAWGRIDITSGAGGTGCQIVAAATSNVWAALDGIHYYGEI